MASLSLMEDGQLVFLAQEGIAGAEECLVLRYQSLVETLASTFEIPGENRISRIAMARSALIRAIRTFKFGKGMIFRSYARRVITNEFRDVYRSATKRSAVPHLAVVSIDDPVGDSEGALSLEEVTSRPVQTEREDLVLGGQGKVEDQIKRSLSGFLMAMQGKGLLPEDIGDAVLDLIDLPAEELRIVAPSLSRRPGMAGKVLSAYVRILFQALMLRAAGFEAADIAEELDMPERVVRMLLLSVRDAVELPA